MHIGFSSPSSSSPSEQMNLRMPHHSWPLVPSQHGGAQGCTGTLFLVGFPVTVCAFTGTTPVTTSASAVGFPGLVLNVKGEPKGKPWPLPAASQAPRQTCQLHQVCLHPTPAPRCHQDQQSHCNTATLQHSSPYLSLLNCIASCSIARFAR